MVKRTVLLGPDGQPVDRAVLTREVATPTVTGVRSIVSDAVASGLSPERLAGLLRAAAQGHVRDYLTLAEEMEERYLHYASQVQTRRLAIESVEISVEAPKGVPAKIVDAVAALVADDGLLEAAGALTDGIAKGVSVVEPQWEYQDGALKPVEYIWRDPRYFHFDRVGQTKLRLAVDGRWDGEEPPPGAFIAHLPRSKAGIPIRRGFARAAAWAFLIQSFVLKDWAAFCEIYGVPFRVGKYHPGASEADKRTLLRAVSSIANDAAAIIPRGMEIEFVVVQGAKGEQVFGGLADYLDKQISKLVVGQTMTADDGASMAQAKVHNEVRGDILKADCRQLANTLNRDLVRWFVALNFGPQPVYPQIRLPVADPEDIKALTEAAERVVPLGLKISQREMRERLGFSEPAEDDELLTPPGRPPEIDTGGTASRARTSREALLGAGIGDRLRAARALADSMAHHAACWCPACNGKARLAAEPGYGPEGLDVEAELTGLVGAALDDWQELADPMFAPLRAALEEASSFDELLAALPKIAGRMDGTKLADVLAKLTAIARGLGDVSD